MLMDNQDYPSIKLNVENTCNVGLTRLMQCNAITSEAYEKLISDINEAFSRACQASRKTGSGGICG